MPFSVESADISTSIAIAETIIVGDVPNIYMEMETGTDYGGIQSDILKILD